MRTRLRVAVFGLIAAGFLPSSAAAADELAVSRSSAVDFTVYVKAIFTMKQEGQFKDFDGQVNYNPSDPSSTRLNLTVYTASVDTHDAGHDNMLRSPDFFDAAQFPTMRFLSTSVSVAPDGRLQVAGDLTIRGITQHLAVPVTVRQVLQRDAPAATRFETTFDIDRTDFGLNGSPRFGGLNVSVAKKVRIHLAIVAGGAR